MQICKGYSNKSAKKYSTAENIEFVLSNCSIVHFGFISVGFGSNSGNCFNTASISSLGSALYCTAISHIAAFISLVLCFFPIDASKYIAGNIVFVGLFVFSTLTQHISFIIYYYTVHTIRPIYIHVMSYTQNDERETHTIILQSH